MKTKNFLFLKIIFFYSLLFMTIIAQATTNTPPQDDSLIPRRILFSNPEKTNATISPDGAMIAFLAPVNGVLNVWVAHNTDLSHAKPVTNEKKRDIRNYFWTYNNQFLGYAQDKDGDENMHLYFVNLKSKKIKDLTPFPKVRADIIKASINHPNEILIGLNRRNSEWHDVYRLNITSGKITLIEENNQFSDFLADEDLNLRIAQKPTDENSPEFYFKNQKTGQWQFYERVPFEDALTTFFLNFNQDGSIAYKIDSQGQDKAALYAYSFVTGKKTLLAKDIKADINGVLSHPTHLYPQAWASEYTKIAWSILDRDLIKDFSYLKKAYAADFNIIDRSLADDKWIVQYYSDTKPARFYLYERNPKTGSPLKLTFLFTTLQSFEKLSLAPMHPVIIKSRDDLDLISYLTLPKSAQINQQNTPKKPLPMVLLVHGGPWARDSWGLSRYAQWLANRGYAVLSVNYRGSTGLGKAFLNAGNKEWAGKMHNDLIDTVTWAIKEKIADPKKIAIMGGSYGGYATLVGLTFTPDTFACGVSIVGPSNLVTLIKSVPPYWKPDIALFKKRVGDIDTEDGKKLLQERSPLTFANRIKKPLLILQGEHDPRVSKAEADQLVNSMKEKSIPVTYVLYHDEGHGFLREPNQISSNAIIEQFLADNLNGRAEKITNDFEGANFSILEGKDYIHSLRQDNNH